jgi:hypothetical protein
MAIGPRGARFCTVLQRCGDSERLGRGAPTALFAGQRCLIVGAASPEATRTALTVGDFDAVYQHAAVFDLLGMVPATERARGLPAPDELHISDGTAERRATTLSKGRQAVL